MNSIRQHTILVDDEETFLVSFHVLCEYSDKREFQLQLFFEKYCLYFRTNPFEIPANLVTSDILQLKGPEIASITFSDYMGEMILKDGTVINGTGGTEPLSAKEIQKNQRILKCQQNNAPPPDELSVIIKLAEGVMAEYRITRPQAKKIIQAMIALGATSPSHKRTETEIIKKAGLKEGTRIADPFTGRSGEAPKYPEFRKRFIINSGDYSSSYYLKLS